MKGIRLFKINPQLKRAIAFFMLVTGALIAVEILPIILPDSEFAHHYNNYKASVCVAAIFFWLISLYVRITQPQTKRYLVTTSFIMIFWMMVRTVKYEYSSFFEMQTIRILWYLYYVGILNIPVLTLVIALSVGRSENYKTPTRIKLMFVPSGILFLFVITNDFHQLVFKFTNGFDDPDSYVYGIVYYMCAVWIGVVLTWAFIVLIKRCRVPYNKKIIYFPFVPIAILAIYAVCYILQVLGVIPVERIFTDMTTIDCTMIMCAFEFCIACGLIPSNSGYSKLFSISPIDAIITDRKYNTIVKSENFNPYPPEITECDSIITKNNRRVSKSSIGGGYIIWQEDVSRLVHTLEELEDIDEFLQGRVSTLQQEYEAEKKHRQLVEQNRIYNLMQNKTANQMKMISALTDEFEHTQDKQREKYLLSKIAVVCAFLKRRNNLIFLSQDQSELPTKELSYCMRESMNNLQLANVSCSYNFQLDEVIPFFVLVELYEVFEQIVEVAFDGMQVMFVNIKQSSDCYKLTARVVTKSDLSQLSEKMELEEEEENDFFITYSVGKEADLWHLD